MTVGEMKTEAPETLKQSEQERGIQMASSHTGMVLLELVANNSCRKGNSFFHEIVHPAGMLSRW